MAATPFKGLLETMYRNGAPGPSFRFSASDVANAFVTFDDLPATPSSHQFPAGLHLADITLSAAGVDTKALVITKGTSTTDKILRDAVLVETLAGKNGRDRLGRLFGIPFEPGMAYGLKQLA